MDIKLIPAGKKDGFTFPALPEKLKGSYATKYQSFDLIAMGNVKVPRGMNVSTYSWEGEFFGDKFKNHPVVQINSWRDPTSCVRVLTNYMKNGTVLNLIIPGTWINEDVTISSFQATPYGPFGSIKYSIELAVKQPLQIYTTTEKKISTTSASANTKTTTNRSTASKDTSRKYTVVQGDNLWSIARKYYGGSGADWTKIYNANKTVIEDTAKKYRSGKGSDKGSYIYPGTVLVIP